jgi:hypothetical protein
MMWGLDCSYYDRKFSTLAELLQDITVSGMDPNYEITRDGIPIGEKAIEHIVM